MEGHQEPWRLEMGLEEEGLYATLGKVMRRSVI